MAESSEQPTSSFTLVSQHPPDGYTRSECGGLITMEASGPKATQCLCSFEAGQISHAVIDEEHDIIINVHSGSGFLFLHPGEINEEIDIGTLGQPKHLTVGKSVYVPKNTTIQFFTKNGMVNRHTVMPEWRNPNCTRVVIGRWPPNIEIVYGEIEKDDFEG